MLTLEERLAVVNLYEDLGSYRAVAAIVGCDHKTVKAHVERSRRGAVVPRVVRRRATDPFGISFVSVSSTPGAVSAVGAC